MDYDAALAAINGAAARLRAISWTLSQADGSLQEAAQAAQDAQDQIDELIPPRP